MLVCRSKFRSTAMYTHGCVYTHSTVALLINGGYFKSISTPPLSQRWEHFSKIGHLVPIIQQFQLEPREPIFEKCSHLWGVLMLFPGLCGGLYGQNLPYKFKKSYGDFWNRNFEKLHRTTGPRSDLRPDSWPWANSGLDTTPRIFEIEKFWVTTRSS
jgi:hypothetical protein